MSCQSSKNGKRTCSQLIRVLEPLSKNISWRGHICYSPSKKNSTFFGREFRKDCCRFLEDLVSTIFSTVAACSPVGQGLSCFCPELIIGGDEYSAFHLFRHLLDELLELGCFRGSEIEPADANFHSFVREHRQMEVTGSRSRVPINSIFAFCNQLGLRSRKNLQKVSIMVLQNHLGPLMILDVCCFRIFYLTALVVRGPSDLHPLFTVFLDGVAINHEKVNGAVACVQDFVRHPLLTKRNFFSETWISMLKTAVAAADAVRRSSEFDPWRAIGVEAGPVIANFNSCQEKVVLRRMTVKDKREWWFGAKTVASSAVGETAPRTTVCISDVVEVGDVHYIEEHIILGVPCCSWSLSSPGKSKKRRVPVKLVVTKKNNSPARVRLLAVLNLKLPSRKVLRSRVPEEEVAIVAMPLCSSGDINKRLIA